MRKSHVASQSQRNSIKTAYQSVDLQSNSKDKSIRYVFTAAIFLKQIQFRHKYQESTINLLNSSELNRSINDPVIERDEEYNDYHDHRDVMPATVTRENNLESQVFNIRINTTQEEAKE